MYFLPGIFCSYVYRSSEYCFLKVSMCSKASPPAVTELTRKNLCVTRSLIFLARVAKLSDIIVSSKFDEAGEQYTNKSAFDWPPNASAKVNQ